MSEAAAVAIPDGMGRPRWADSLRGPAREAVLQKVEHVLVLAADHTVSWQALACNGYRINSGNASNPSNLESQSAS